MLVDQPMLHDSILVYSWWSHYFFPPPQSPKTWSDGLMKSHERQTGFKNV